MINLTFTMNPDSSIFIMFQEKMGANLVYEMIK